MAQRKPRRDPRTALLKAGTRLFAAHGFDTVSIDDIAADAGVAKGLLYYYFESKRALYVEIVRVAAESLAEYTEPDRSLPPSERTGAVITALIRWAENYGESLRMLFGQGIGPDPELATIMRDARERQIEMMWSGMAEVRAEQGLPPLTRDPVLLHAIRGWIAFTEAVLTRWLADRDLTEDQLRELVLRAAGGLLSAARKITTENATPST
ncbi:TetR/AcrR family transcriptional regulator [Herbihabitans rhizosphaerae]|uniref:TetR/AcrR family transcriptional regulator n=1 Tax=Herbihabitans rhizosphaerae TaxID=1872711 RepID=UPI0013EEC339|nr:TetR/AcrR family transcriptional regulator [Herbihabitans rhizosphaerae]